MKKRMMPILVLALISGMGCLCHAADVSNTLSKKSVIITQEVSYENSIEATSGYLIGQVFNVSETAKKTNTSKGAAIIIGGIPNYVDLEDLQGLNSTLSYFLTLIPSMSKDPVGTGKVFFITKSGLNLSLIKSRSGINRTMILIFGNKGDSITSDKAKDFQDIVQEMITEMKK